MDEDDPDVLLFQPEEAPCVFTPGYTVLERCRCISPPLPTCPGDQGHYAATFSYNPPWGDKGEENDRKEECRRICWAALALMSTYTASCAVFHQEPVHLKLTDPSNVRASHIQV